MPPWLPNFRRMRSRASAWSRRCRATYSSVDSPLSAAEPLESPPEKPPAEKPPPGPSYADAGAAWRAGSSVGSGRPSTFAFRRSAYSVEAGSWYLALCSIFGSTPCFFQNAWRSALPPFVIIASCLWFHESMVTDRTNEMCTPERFTSVRSARSRTSEVSDGREASLVWSDETTGRGSADDPQRRRGSSTAHFAADAPRPGSRRRRGRAPPRFGRHDRAHTGPRHRRGAAAAARPLAHCVTGAPRPVFASRRRRRAEAAVRAAALEAHERAVRHRRPLRVPGGAVDACVVAREDPNFRLRKIRTVASLEERSAEPGAPLRTIRGAAAAAHPLHIPRLRRLAPSPARDDVAAGRRPARFAPQKTARLSRARTPARTCICGVMETAIVWMERPMPFLEMASFLWLFRLRRWRR